MKHLLRALALPLFLVARSFAAGPNTFEFRNPANNATQGTIDNNGNLNITAGVSGAAVTAASGTFTQTGTGNYSVQGSSSIKILAGGYVFPDGTVLYSTAGIQASGGVTVGTSAVSWVQDNFRGQANGTQKVFNLSQSPTNTNGFGVSVVLDGLLQNNPTDYTFTPPNVISMTTAPTNTTQSFFAYYTVNTSTLPGVATQTGSNVFSGPANSFTYGISAGSAAIAGSLTASSGTFTRTGTGNFSLQTSSSISIGAGGLSLPDGTVLYSTAGLQATGGTSVSTQTINWVQDNFRGQANGTNSVFTLSQTPSTGTAIEVILDGLVQSASDYTYAAPVTITMTTAPANTTQSFFARYTVNTSTLPNAAITTIANNFTSTNTFAAVGIGTTTPIGFFTVGQSTGLVIFQNGHVESYGPNPIISACGTTPNGSVVGTDEIGTITVGGGVVNSCTMTFNSPWNNSPVCIPTDNSSAISTSVTSVSATSVTFGTSATLGGGIIYYHCFGRR